MFVKKLGVFSRFELFNPGLKDHKLNDTLQIEEVLV